MQHEDIGGLRELAFRRVEVAKEDLETAKMNLKAEHYRAANNRAYYITLVIKFRYLFKNLV